MAKMRVCSASGVTARPKNSRLAVGFMSAGGGLAANHHFVLSVHEGDYRFKPGTYEIEVIADVVGRRKPVTLSVIKLSVSDELATALQKQEGVLFERMIGGDYEGHARPR